MKYTPRIYAKALAAVAAGPLTPEKERAIVQNFARVIMERGDRKQWPKILAATDKALRQKEGRRKVTFESARPIKDLLSAFQDLLKKSDITEEKVDPRIVAGVKITLDDTRQYDGSLASKLNKLFA
jgi:F0F1-type ATP synthase delta subunit